MRSPSRPHTGPLQFNMTPMIDVVFLLIIFFLVSSHLARQESHLPLPLPAAESGEARDEMYHQRVVVNVKLDGAMSLAGRNVSSDELERRLQNEHERVGADLEVRIRCDRNVPFQFVRPILLAVSGLPPRNGSMPAMVAQSVIGIAFSGHDAR